MQFPAESLNLTHLCLNTMHLHIGAGTEWASIKFGEGSMLTDKGQGLDHQHASITIHRSPRITIGASLVVQWLRICLLMQGTRVRALVWEDPHMPRSNWAREPQLLSLRVWSLCSATREAATVIGPRTAMKSGPRSPQLEKALAQKRRPTTAKNK